MTAIVDHQRDFEFREDPRLKRAIRRIEAGYPLPIDMQTELLAEGYDVQALIDKHTP